MDSAVLGSTILALTCLPGAMADHGFAYGTGAMLVAWLGCVTWAWVLRRLYDQRQVKRMESDKWT